MSNFWNEDAVSEYEMMSDDIEYSAAAAEEIADSIVDEMEVEDVELVEASDEQIEYVQEEAAYSLDKKESNIIYNARLRLEQAKLYEMLINHSLFAGVDASPDAINIVENELKHYIVKRLEVLLGIRKPKPKPVDSEATIELPFNSVEVDFLKQLAYKGTHGQSAGDLPVTIRPKTALNPLGGSTKTLPLAPPKTQNKTVPPVVAPKKPTQPPADTRKTTKKKVKARPKKNNTGPTTPKISSGGSMRERKLTEAEVLELAKADIESLKNRKPIDKLKGKAKIDAIKEVNERHKRKVATGGQAFPTDKQLEMHYLTREANGRSPQDVLNGMVKTLLNSKKMKLGE